MRAIIKGSFAVMAGLLYLLAGATVLAGALWTAGFEPNTGQTYLLDAAGAALVAFISAQLGLAIATGGTDSFRSKVNTTMGASATADWGARLLLLDALIFGVVGLLFVLLWVKPDLVAVAGGADSLTNAPEYVDMYSRVFLGVVFAALAALAPSA